MASPFRLPGFVMAGVLLTMALLFFGLVLSARPPGNATAFWVGEVVLIVIVWRTILYALRPDIGGWASPGRRPSPLALGVVLCVFLALWIFSVVLSGGRTELPILAGYAVASGALLFLASLPNRWTDAAPAVRIPLLAGGAFMFVVVGFLFLLGVAKL